ncbi:hypothetical protein ABE021_15390 [Sporosarcina gallistercoris]|uniref:hypothetical protein n=1 Tax=Sporosarcina gallistercoris TaxID=2762245 RepID=UPI003D27DC14
MDKVITVEYSFRRFDDGLEMMEVEAEATTYDVETDERIVLGGAIGYVFKPYGSVRGWRDAVCAADAVSGDVVYTLTSLEEHHNGFTPGVFVLDSIEIHEQYRNQNYGQRFMEVMMEDLFFLDVDLIGLTPGFYTPSATEEQKKWNPRLVAFYKRLGFELVETDVDEGDVNDGKGDRSACIIHGAYG